MAGKSIADLMKEVVLQSGQTKDSVIMGLIDSNEAFKGTLIPDEVYAGLGLNNLMSLEAARNHKDISVHFKGRYLNDVDRRVEKYLTKLGFSEDEAQAIIGEKDSLKKLDTLFDQVSEKVNSQAASGSGKMTDEEKQKFLEKINGFPGQLRAKDEEWTGKLTTLQQKLDAQQAEFEQERIDNILNAKLSNYKFGEALPREDYIKIVKDKLKEKDFILKREKDGLKPFQKENPDLNYFRDNKEVSFDPLLDEIAAPYLAKVDNGQQQNNQQQQQRKIQTNPEGVKTGTVGALGADKILKAAQMVQKK